MSSSPVAARVVAFVCDAFRYAAIPSDANARRLIGLSHSGVSRGVARAGIAASGERGDLRQAIAAERVPLDRGSLADLRRFTTALDEISAAYRVQGSNARELLAGIRLAFALDANANEDERATLAHLERCADEFDSSAPSDWDARLAAENFARIAAGLPRPAERSRPEAVTLGPHAPEARAQVVRPHSHFSASSLGAYAECERKWYYRYVCSAVEDKGSSASFYGRAFHWALEQFHHEFPRADAAPKEVLQAKLDGWIQTAFERFRGRFDTNVEYELQTRRARRTARRYLDWFFERSRAHPFTVVEAEAKVELEMGGQKFKGFIDRLDRDDASGAVTVVDYKTGSIAESADEYRERIAAFVDFQLPFYYWARTAQGDRVSRLALVPLKDALRDVAPIELEVVPVAAPATRRFGATSGTIGIDELERARAKMIELAQRLAVDPIERFAPTDDPEACVFCSYRNACRGRPLRREERFSA